MLGVSERTLLRRRVDSQLPIGRPYSEISDNNLDAAVREIIEVSLSLYNSACVCVCCLSH